MIVNDASKVIKMMIEVMPQLGASFMIVIEDTS